MIIKQHYWYLIFLIKFKVLIRAKYISSSTWLCYFCIPLDLYIIAWVYLECRIIRPTMNATDLRVVPLSDTVQDQESLYCSLLASWCINQKNQGGSEQMRKLMMNLLIFVIGNTSSGGYSIITLSQIDQNFPLACTCLIFGALSPPSNMQNFTSSPPLPPVISWYKCY